MCAGIVLWFARDSEPLVAVDVRVGHMPCIDLCALCVLGSAGAGALGLALALRPPFGPTFGSLGPALASATINPG